MENHERHAGDNTWSRMNSWRADAGAADVTTWASRARPTKKNCEKLKNSYQNNSCDECHTRHTFAKSEAQDPRTCQQCHMGYDHPQWEMWRQRQAWPHGGLPKTRDICLKSPLRLGVRTVIFPAGPIPIARPGIFRHPSAAADDKDWAVDRSNHY